MSLTPGQNINNRYRIVKLFGQGGLLAILALAGLIALSACGGINPMDQSGQQAATQTSSTLPVSKDQPTTTPIPPTIHPTDTPTPTNTPVLPTQTPVATDTDIPTDIPTSAPPLVLKFRDYNPGFTHYASGYCYNLALECWIIQITENRSGWGVRTGYSYTGGQLQTEGEVLIDPQWTNPALAFWHLYDRFDIKGTFQVILQHENVDEILKEISVGPSRYWHEEMIPIGAFAGKSIRVIFNIQQCDSCKRNYWAIQNIRIIPDYSPTP